MRSVLRLPLTPARLAALPDAARASRSDAVAAVARAREQHRSLEETGSEYGVSVATIRFWLPDAVGRTRAGRTPPTAADRHLRRRPLAVEGEVTLVPIRGSRATQQAVDAFGLQWRFVHNEATAEDLERLHGMRIGGRTVESDPAVLERLANAGQFRIDEIYRELFP
jgi:hypothetical protein